MSTSPESAEESKRLLGQYFTTGNPFMHPAFERWWHESGAGSVLEPFAGADNLPALLAEAGFDADFTSYDIEPGAPTVTARDTLADFPRGHDVIVTNPPYLARHFARRKGLAVDHLPWGQFDNLWKVAIDQCLQHAPYVAAILPDSFVTSGLFRPRLRAVVSLTDRTMFQDTETPTCLALWGPDERDDFEIWCAERRLGTYNALTRQIPHATASGERLTFNTVEGQIGLRAIDNTHGPSIAFCPAGAIAEDRVRRTGRLVTRITVTGLAPDAVPDVIREANDRLKAYREATADVLLTAFKGVRKDGMFRRRLDFDTARALLSETLDSVLAQWEPTGEKAVEPPGA